MITFSQMLADADPMLSPSWRWQAAQELAASQETGRTDDVLIQEAVKYLQSGNQQLYPTIDAARTIHEADGLLRAEIEARILAGQWDAQIATCCNIAPATVAIYEQLFFAVRRYAEAADWLLRQTVGDARFRGFWDHELRPLWAWFALAGGAVVVDEVIQAFYAASECHDAPSLSVYFGRESGVAPELQLMVASLVMLDGAGDGKTIVPADVIQAEVCPADERIQAAIAAINQAVIECARHILSGTRSANLASDVGNESAGHTTTKQTAERNERTAIKACKAG